MIKRLFFSILLSAGCLQMVYGIHSTIELSPENLLFTRVWIDERSGSELVYIIVGVDRLKAKGIVAISLRTADARGVFAEVEIAETQHSSKWLGGRLLLAGKDSENAVKQLVTKEKFRFYVVAIRPSVAKNAEIMFYPDAPDQPAHRDYRLRLKDFVR